MATGSVLDIVGRLQRWFPTRWFPTQAVNADGSVPRIYAMLTGAATVFSNIYNAIVYARAQTRTPTSTDGWLDLRSRDLLGKACLRLPGEADPSFQARIQTMVLQRANTKAALKAGILALTGEEPEIVEPWNTGDTGVWDGLPGAGAQYYDVDLPGTPARYSDPSLRYQMFITSTLPSISGLGAAAMPAYDTSCFYDTPSFYYADLAPTQNQGLAALLAVIQRLKVLGTVAWLKVVPHPQEASLFWDEPGVNWDQPGKTWDQSPNN